MFKAQLSGDILSKDLQRSTCLIPISMNQPLQDGEKLQASIQLLNKTFASCTIVIADALYRHTFPEEKAIKMGDAWLNKNQAILNNIKIPQTIMRWNHYLKQPNFEYFIKLINKLFKTETAFQKATHHCVTNFIKRATQKQMQTNIKLEDSELYQRSLNYIKEECAVWLQWAHETKPHDFIIYPNKLYEPLNFLRRYFPTNNNTKQLQALTINFRKLKQTVELHCYNNSELNYNNLPNTATIDITCAQLKNVVQQHIDHIFELTEQVSNTSKTALLSHGISNLQNLINNTNIVEKT